MSHSSVGCDCGGWKRKTGAYLDVEVRDSGNFATSS